METYFASAPKVPPKELERDIVRVSTNPVIDGLMGAVGGLLAVLNDSRQIISVNDSLLKTLGLHDAREALGLRPGEVLHCIHAHEEPHGCGTTKHCASCGAAIAIVTSLANETPVEKKCIIRVTKGGKETDLCFRVRACPVTIQESRYLLLFLQDISSQEKRAALERAFFHDINNILSGLLGASELLQLNHREEDAELTMHITQMVSRLANEIAVQRSLLHSGLADLQPTMQEIAVADILKELRPIFVSHSVTQGKILHIDTQHQEKILLTDSSLLIRILSNMLTNAFEASESGDTVRLWLEQDTGQLCFCVWNRQVVDESVRLRIFQRYISTKQGVGRGTGTYSMKLFGETFLNGSVSFTSSPADGTVFRICLPN